MRVRLLAARNLGGRDGDGAAWPRRLRSQGSFGGRQVHLHAQARGGRRVCVLVGSGLRHGGRGACESAAWSRTFAAADVEDFIKSTEHFGRGAKVTSSTTLARKARKTAVQKERRLARRSTTGYSAPRPLTTLKAFNWKGLEMTCEDGASSCLLPFSSFLPVRLFINCLLFFGCLSSMLSSMLGMDAQKDTNRRV